MRYPGIGTGQWHDRRPGRQRRHGAPVGALAAVVLALAFAAPAWAAAPTATATVAPIGTGSYLLTLTNVSSAPISGFVVPASAESAANVAPAPACRVGTNTTPVEIDAAVICNVTVAPGASTQVCYAGHAPGLLIPLAGEQMQVLLVGAVGGDISQLVAGVTLAPAVASCPLAGFTKSSPSSVAHAWKHAQCVFAFRSWKTKHRHASAKQRKAEQRKLKTQHGC